MRPRSFLWLFCVKVYLDFYIEYNRHTKHKTYSMYLDIPLYLWYNKYTKYIVYFSQKGWYKYWPIRQEKHETHTSESGTRKTPKSAENTSADIGRRWGRLHQKVPQTPQKPKISHKSAGGMLVNDRKEKALQALLVSPTRKAAAKDGKSVIGIDIQP